MRRLSIIVVENRAESIMAMYQYAMKVMMAEEKEGRLKFKSGNLRSGNKGEPGSRIMVGLFM